MVGDYCTRQQLVTKGPKGKEEGEGRKEEGGRRGTATPQWRGQVPNVD